MALQAMKDTKLAGALCRLNPSASPSKRANKGAGPSRILAAFDAAMLGENNKLPHARAAQANAPIDMSQYSTHTSLPHANTSRQRKMEQQQLLLKKVKPSSLYAKPKSAKSYPKPSSSKSLGRGTSSHGPSTTASAQASTTLVLPLYSHKDYSPRPAVVYVRHEDEANELVQSLSGPLGFDMEWVVPWRKGSGSERRTAVVQLCDKHMILVIQVSEMKRFPQNVKDVIESRDVVKMGANIRNDGEKLYCDYGILASNLVELGAFAHRADATFVQTYTRSIVALAKVVAHYTGKTLDKGKARSSNWEKAPLSEEQITYAANDAHCALMVYNRLLTIAAEQGRSLGPTPYGSSISHTPAPPSAVATSSAGGGTHRSVSYVSDVADLPQGSESWRPSPQHLRAYNLWHHKDMPLQDICAALRTRENPLKESTVISYVIRALETDPALPFSIDRLKALVQLEAGSWTRHRNWLVKAEAQIAH